jgi:hypothetical protein
MNPQNRKGENLKENRDQSPQRKQEKGFEESSLLRIWTLLLLFFLLYLYAPWPLVKLLSLLWGFWYFCQLLSSRVRAHFCFLAVLLCYLWAFLWNPFYLYLPYSQYHWPTQPLEVLILLTVLGILWSLLIQHGSPILLGAKLPSFRGMWILSACLLCYLPTWDADIPYKGDESFHFSSIHFCKLGVYLFFESHPFGIASLFLLLLLALGGLYRPRSHVFSFLEKVGLLVFFLLGATFIPFLSTSELWNSLEPFIQTRMARYPLAPAWISAFAEILAGSSKSVEISYPLYRLWPLVSLLGIGWVLASDPRVSSCSGRAKEFGLVLILTTPTFLYHGTLLYLDLALLPPLLILLLNEKIWLWGSPSRLKKSPAFWAALFMVFFKETALPVLLLLVVSREWAQGWRLKKKRKKLLRVREEAVLLLVLFFPLVLYFAIRIHFQERPYEAFFHHLFEGRYWLYQIQTLFQQTGVLCFFALYGLKTLQKRYGRGGMSCFLFGGTQVFLLGVASIYIGLARFNLLLLAPFLWWSWEGILALFAWSPKRFFLILGMGLLLHLFVFSPIEWRSGGRGAWGNSDERWYPYRESFGDIQKQRKEKPKARLILGNMEIPYGVHLLPLTSSFEIHQLPPFVAEDEIQNLQATLRSAIGLQAQWVLYRANASSEVPFKVYEGFHFRKCYPAPLGALWSFERRTDP